MIKGSRTSRHTHSPKDSATPRASHSNAHATRSGRINVTASIYGTTPQTNKSQRRWSRVSFNLQSSVRPELDYGSDTSSEDGDFQLLECLVSTSWKIHHVSPLFNLQVHTARLKQYGKYVREHLSCLNIYSKQNVQYMASFTWFGEMSPKINFQGLQVEVKTIFENKPARTSYMGFFVSCETLPKSSRHGVHLPILLCYGGSKLMLQAVHNILFNMFDCVIVRLPIPETELMWLSAMLNSDPDNLPKQNDMSKFKFEITLNNASNTFSVQLCSNDILNLWHKIHDSRSTLVTYEEVKSFHDSLYYFLRHTYNVDVADCILVMFSLPTLRMASDGSIKMLSKYSAVQALTFLNSLTVKK